METNTANDFDRSQCRGEAYLLLSWAIEYPNVELRTLIGEGGLLCKMQELANFLYPHKEFGLSQKVIDECLGSLETMEPDYLALFEVGGGGKPLCPLYAGHYSSAERNSVMEENLRFFNHFGLQRDQDDGEMPDYLGTQLEFLHYLAIQQVEMHKAGKPGRELFLAERDFIERQLLGWIPKLNEKLLKNSRLEASYYRSILTFLENFLQATKDEAFSEFSHPIPAASGS